MDLLDGYNGLEGEVFGLSGCLTAFLRAVDVHRQVDARICLRKLDRFMALYRLPFWIAAQRAFLKEEFIDDTNWAGVIDKLNERLL